MKILTQKITHQKRSILSPKFTSFLTTLTTQQKPTSKNTLFSPFLIDPYEILSQWKNSNSKAVTIKDVKLLHTHLLKTSSLHTDKFLANSLIDWYWKFSAVRAAHHLFGEMPEINYISWNIMISGFNFNHLYDGAWRCFCRMRSMGSGSNEFTYGSVISACGGLGKMLYGKMIYALTMKDGFFTNGFVRSGLIDLFAKNGGFEDALQVFYDWPYDENVVCWNTVIGGAVKSGDKRRALELFDQMRRLDVFPNSFTLSSVLSACVALGDHEVGKKVHGLVIKHAAGDDVFIGTSIVDFYAKCGDMDEATKGFLRLPVQNVVSWTVLISGYVQKDDAVSATKLFTEMRKMGVEVNKYSITSILSACAELRMIDLAMQMHSWILKSGFSEDSTVIASLINTYSKGGEVGLSELLYLEQEDLKDQSVLTSVISSFVQNHNLGKATELFKKMLMKGLKPDSFAISGVLSIVNHLNFGRQVHTYTLKTGLIYSLTVGSSLFTMYSKCGRPAESYEIFLQLPHKDIVSWASMISGFVEHGNSDKAIQLFREMLNAVGRPDERALVGVISACSSNGSLLQGKEVHGYAFRIGITKHSLIGGALVNMYSKCAAMELARRVFDMVPHKDAVLCTSIVSAYAKKGDIGEALRLLHEMLVADMEVDPFTVSSILGSEALLDRTDIGVQLHALITKLGLQSDVSVGSSLIKMYTKRGAVDDCRKAFDQIINPDLISWTSMILSYAQQGKGTNALELYEAMRSEGIKPDSVTFVGVLSACSHSGLIEEGYSHLKSMSKSFGIEPEIHHYACMVDLLGRSGRLKEAEKFIQDMPIKPDAFIWGTFLASCKVHGDVELGRLAATKVFELGPSDPGAYVALSNIYAEIGQWEEVEEVRSLLKGTGLTKDAGWSHM